MPLALEIEPIRIPFGFRYALPNLTDLAATLWHPSANDAVLTGGASTMSNNPNALLAVRCRRGGFTSLITTPGYSNSTTNRFWGGILDSRAYNVGGSGTGFNIRGLYGGTAFPAGYGQFQRSPISIQNTAVYPETNAYAGIGLAICTRSSIVTLINVGGGGSVHPKDIMAQNGAIVGQVLDGLTLTTAQNRWGTSAGQLHAHINPIGADMVGLNRGTSPSVANWRITWRCAGINAAPMDIQTLDDAGVQTDFEAGTNWFCGSSHNGFFCRIGANGSSPFAAQNNQIIWIAANGRRWAQVELVPLDAVAATEIARAARGVIIAGQDGSYYFKNDHTTGGLNILASPPPESKLLRLSVFRKLPVYGHFDVPFGVKDR